jgi:hypothetical protein
VANKTNFHGCKLNSFSRAKNQNNYTSVKFASFSFSIKIFAISSKMPDSNELFVHNCFVQRMTLIECLQSEEGSAKKNFRQGKNKNVNKNEKKLKLFCSLKGWWNVPQLFLSCVVTLLLKLFMYFRYFSRVKRILRRFKKTQELFNFNKKFFKRKFLT